MEHKQVLELIPAYALSALDAEERRQVEAHLQGCGDCQAELRAYQAVAGELAIVLPQRQPPDGLKRRIMAQALSTRKVAPARASSAWEMLLLSFRRLAPAWGLVSLVLVVALAASNLWLWQRVSRLEKANAFHVVSLAGTEKAPRASGLLVISSNGREGTLVVEHLPELAPANQYQLWLIRDGARTSGGVFSVDSEGYGNLYVESDAPLLSYDAFGVTIEPSGGSPGPTGDKVLGGDL